MKTIFNNFEESIKLKKYKIEKNIKLKKIILKKYKIVKK